MTSEQIKKLDEVHAAIVGNKSMGSKGLAERLLEVELYQERDRAFKNKAIGGLSILSVIGSAITGWLFKHL